jgi:hypothetical protein
MALIQLAFRVGRHFLAVFSSAAMAVLEKREGLWVLECAESDGEIRFQKKSPACLTGLCDSGEPPGGLRRVPLFERSSMTADRPSGNRPAGPRAKNRRNSR